MLPSRRPGTDRRYISRDHEEHSPPPAVIAEFCRGRPDLLKSHDIIEEAELSAAQASLNYVSDDMPGIRRRRSGKGFGYVKPDGTRLTDPKQLERIRGLAIPPAYTDVWISPDPNGHIQATGRDDRGRKQYRYHPRWTAIRDEAKFEQLSAFARALPAIRERVDSDLRKRGLPKDRVLASLIWLLENTMIRVGNHTYAKQNRSFGLTTLRSRHLSVSGSTMHFKFKGKSGKEWNVQLVDRRIVRSIRSMQELPGQHLFQYEDEEGTRRQVHSEDVNAYLREASGADFTSKTFRTWNGTIAALAVLSASDRPESKAATRRALNAAIDEVARLLGNTRAVCRRNYIHPRVIASWEAGTLADEIARARRSRRKTVPGLDEAEMVALNWLEMSAAK
ncbi:MAG: DNA topoisomerase IB [Rhizobiales bacterium]|nr:DNA topoisomerase IB [Hyphomicrobiales bacterium]